MNNFFLDVIYAFFTIVLLGKIISYCIYEIKNESNKFGGIFTIVFSLLSFIFSNIMVWIN